MVLVAQVDLVVLEAQEGPVALVDQEDLVYPISLANLESQMDQVVLMVQADQMDLVAH